MIPESRCREKMAVDLFIKAACRDSQERMHLE